MGSGESTESTGSALNSTTGMKAEVAQVIIASIGVFLLLAYPIGFIALMAQIANTHDYGYTMARYATSLAPSSLVAAKIIFISIYSVAAGVIMVIVFNAVRYADSDANSSVRHEHLRYLAPGALVAVGFLPFLTGQSFLPLPGFIALLDNPIHEQFWQGQLLYVLFSDVFLYVICLAIVAFGGIISYKICPKPDKNDTHSLFPLRSSFWTNSKHATGVGLVYLLALVAGVLFSGINHHHLPEVQLSLNDTTSTALQELGYADELGYPDKTPSAFLLSVSNETWYVIPKCEPHHLLTIPADRVEVMGAQIEPEVSSTCS